MSFHQAYVGIEQSAIGCLSRKLRQTLKLTQEEFAAQLEATFATINRRESVSGFPSPSAVRQIDSLKQLNNSPGLTLHKYGKAVQAKYFLQREERE